MIKKKTKEETEEEKDWRHMAEHSLRNAWDPEDEVWDEFAKKELKKKKSKKVR